MPKKCGDCPLCNNLNCMNVSRQEAMQALKSSTEEREARWKGAGMGDQRHFYAEWKRPLKEVKR